MFITHRIEFILELFDYMFFKQRAGRKANLLPAASTPVIPTQANTNRVHPPTQREPPQPRLPQQPIPKGHQQLPVHPTSLNPWTTTRQPHSGVYIAQPPGSKPHFDKPNTTADCKGHNKRHPGPRKYRNTRSPIRPPV